MDEWDSFLYHYFRLPLAFAHMIGITLLPRAGVPTQTAIGCLIITLIATAFVILGGAAILIHLINEGLP